MFIGIPRCINHNGATIPTALPVPRLTLQGKRARQQHDLSLNLYVKIFV